MAAPLGGPRGSVAGRLGRRWWCRGDPAQGRGEGQEGGVPLPGLLPRPPPSGGARGPGSDWRKAPGARRAASSSGAVQARAPGGGDPPCGPLWATNRTGGAHRGGPRGRGTMESGQDRPGRPRAGRPVRRIPPRASLSSGGAPSTISRAPAAPLLAGSAHTRRPSRRPPPRPRGSRSPRPRARAPSMPRAHGDAGSGVPGTRWSGADHRRGSRPRWITG